MKWINVINANSVTLQTHIRDKTHKCNKCNFASPWEGNQKQHMRIHNGNKAFKCNK